MSSRRLLDVLEAATITEEPTCAWAARVADAAMPLVEGAAHAALLRYDLAEGTLTPLRPESDAIRTAILGGQDSLDQDDLERIYMAAPSVHTSSEVFDGRFPEPYAEMMRAAGLGDCIGVAAVAAESACLGFAVLTDRTARLGDRARAQLTGLGAQLGATTWVRGAMDAIRAGTADRAESTTITGRLAHAMRELDARRARTVRDRTEAAALDVEELWRSLLRDGWALIPMERDGHRTRLVAVRLRRPDASDLRRLQPKEREAVVLAARGLRNKEIGFELGVAESTVATRLQRARQKLGVERRTDLVRIFGRLT